MPTRNTRLAVAIARDGRPAYKIAAAADINSSLLSGIVTGRENPSDAVRGRIAAALALEPAELFELDEAQA